MRIKTILLTVSLVAFAIGFSDGGESTFWYMGRPLGAVFFILFFILTLLEREYDLLDEQNRAEEAKRSALARKPAASPAKPGPAWAPASTR